MPKAAAKQQPTTPGPLHYDVRIQSVRPGEGNLKGTASVNLSGQFAVRGVSIKAGKNGLFVSMPSYQSSGGEYNDYCFPCTKEARAAFDEAVLDAFQQALSQEKSAGQAQAPAEHPPLEYKVRIHSLHPGDGALMGTASVNLSDQFAIRTVRIMEGSNGLFVSMPGFRGRNGEFKDYCFPCTRESSTAFDKAVLDAYRQALTQGQTAAPAQREAPNPFAAQAQSAAPAMWM